MAIALVVLTVLIWTRRDRASETAASVVRLAVTLPQGQDISGGITWLPLALAPDGSRLAYISDGRLFLRRMDSMETQSTLGTEGAWAPFFSPDSQWVGFFAQGQLKKISVAGGVAQRICDAATPAGASWGSDDFIYFAPSNGSALSKVAAGGGTPVPFTTLDRANGEVSHRWPQVLPDVKAVLFTSWNGPGFDEMELQAHILATGERRHIMRGANTGRYVHSGHIVYTHGGELTGARFNLQTLSVSGGQVPLGISVLEGEGSYYDVSHAGLLVYVSGASQFERRIAATTLDGKTVPLPLPPRAYEDVKVSPDGSKLAVTVSGATWGVWIADVASNTLSPFTTGAESSQWPVWTADGKRIIYRGTRKGSRNLYWKAADGSGVEERLTTSPNLQTPNSVSADGLWLAYDEVDPQTSNDIWLLSLSDRRSRALVNTPSFDSHARFSPDGHWIAYNSDDSGRLEIYVQPFPGSSGRIPVSTEGGAEAVWARNGRALFYISGRHVTMSEISTSPVLRFGGFRRIFAAGSTASTRPFGLFDVSPDSRFFSIQRVQETHTQLNVVVNWFEELRQKVPVQ